jgi:NCS1 family nucleobase:cation symporter-1
VIVSSPVPNETWNITHISEDYLITKGNGFIGHLYNPSKSNRHYYYTKGWNIQAVIAYLCGIALPFPGFVGTLGPKVSTSATNLGRLGWLLSFTVSFVIYYVLCIIWPTKNQKLIKEMNLRWEEECDERIFTEDGTEIVEIRRNVIAQEGFVGEEYGVAGKY